MTTLQSRFAALLLLLPLLAFTFIQSGCSSLNRTQRGAIIGAGGGAVVGGVIGRAAGNTAAGAVIGAAVGGAAGAVIGRRMDQQAEELDQELENATVEPIPGDDGNTAGIQIVFDNALLFDFDSSQLRPGVRADLSQLANSLQNYPNHDALIVGHTDATGTDSYNQSLSERRANAVRSYLLSQGVSGVRLETLGMGESQPIADNSTDYGRQQNRRVEIAIYANEQYQQEMRDEYDN